MKITDRFSVSELARLTGKSRPSVYKYLLSYEMRRFADLPALMADLFRAIEAGEPRERIEQFALVNFGRTAKPGVGEDEVEDVCRIIRDHREKIDLSQLKEYLLKEIGK